MSEPLRVVGAAILESARVLCAQKDGTGPLAGLWEFPGGKVEPEESPRAALRREVLEELSCEIDVGDLLTTTSHAYEFATISLSVYLCSLRGGRPIPVEHQRLRWVAAEDLDSLDWAPADREAVRKLGTLLA